MSLSSLQLATFAGDGGADSIELKSLSPQIDTAALSPSSPPQTTEQPSATKIHKLEASKQALKEEVDESQTSLPVEQGQQRGAHIYINTFTFRSNVTTSTIDPFVLMRAMFAGRKGMEKLYAERDTGYGVCGFLLNMPVGKRGYASVLKTFPSMPASEADLHSGDLIVSVNGQSTLDIPAKDVWDWFTGMPGTEVKLEIRRGDQPIDVSLRRMDIGRIPDFSTRAEFLTIFERNGMSKFVQR